MGSGFLIFFNDRSIVALSTFLLFLHPPSVRRLSVCHHQALFPRSREPDSRPRSIEATHLLRQMGVVGIDVIVSSWRKRHTSVVTDTVLSSGTIDPTASFCPVLRRLGGRVGELRGRRWRRRDWVWLVIPHPVYRHIIFRDVSWDLQLFRRHHFIKIFYSR